MMHEPGYYFRTTDLIEAATRYYIGRQTAAACDHARRIRRAWDDLPLATQDVILKDLDRALDEEGGLGGEPERKEWLGVISYGRQRVARRHMHAGGHKGFWHDCVETLYMVSGEVAFEKGKSYLCVDEHAPRGYGDYRWVYCFKSDTHPYHEIFSGDDWQNALVKGREATPEESEDLE
jgi:hypothetical protein